MCSRGVPGDEAGDATAGRRHRDVGARRSGPPRVHAPAQSRLGVDRRRVGLPGRRHRPARSARVLGGPQPRLGRRPGQPGVGGGARWSRVPRRRGAGDVRGGRCAARPATATASSWTPTWPTCGRTAMRSTRARTTSRPSSSGTRSSLATDELHLFSHWITPPGGPRRYDTWFFVAAAPPGHYVHDDRELIASGWVRPADALAAADRNEIDLILPTRTKPRDTGSVHERGRGARRRPEREHPGCGRSAAPGPGSVRWRADRPAA